jgi:hypothetical protein
MKYEIGMVRAGLYRIIDEEGQCVYTVQQRLREVGRPFEGESGSDEDPNRPVPLCREHAKEHHDHWDAMWDDHYRGLL